jgi:hypothetical protein
MAGLDAVLAELVKDGYVAIVEMSTGKRGRPPSALVVLNPAAPK